MAFQHSPIELDRALARAAGQWTGWRRRLRAEPPTEDEDDDVLAHFRDLTGQQFFRELRDLPEHDPLRSPLQRWVYRLAEQRINCDPLTRRESERRSLREVPEAPGRSAVSVARMLQGCLQDPARSRIWMRLFLEHAPPVSAISVELWQRRAEIARRMGLTGPAEIEASLHPPAAESGAVPLNAAEVARRLAELLRDRMRELDVNAPADLLELSMGRDVRGNWPARLSLQRLTDYFREGDLLRSLDLQPEPMPQPYGAASFCRGLSVLGAAWLEALAPRDQPFVVAHDPYGLRRHEAASLFALLPLNQKFLGRHMELPRTALPDVQRRLAQLWLIDLAQAAFRMQLRAPALAGESPFREAFSELANRDLNVSMPPKLAGALFSLEIEDEQRLLGRLLALQREREFIDAHDEDWFRNPRAIEQLRAEANRPPDVEASVERVASALRELPKRLDRLLR